MRIFPILILRKQVALSIPDELGAASFRHLAAVEAFRHGYALPNTQPFRTCSSKTAEVHILLLSFELWRCRYGPITPGHVYLYPFYDVISIFMYSTKNVGPPSSKKHTQQSTTLSFVHLELPQRPAKNSVAYFAVSILGVRKSRLLTNPLEMCCCKRAYRGRVSHRYGAGCLDQFMYQFASFSGTLPRS